MENITNGNGSLDSAFLIGGGVSGSQGPIPRTSPHPSINNYLPGNGGKKRTESLSGNPDEDNILLHSFDYIRSLPGKVQEIKHDIFAIFLTFHLSCLQQVRSKLSVAFNYWLKVEPEILEKVCDIVELLHNASLL